MPDLSALQRKNDFYSHGPEWVRALWKTAAQFDWFIKNHRDELERRGVIAKLSRDWLIDTANFQGAIEQMLKPKRVPELAQD